MLKKHNERHRKAVKTRITEEGCGKMFETGEYVVYGRTGICQVTGVTTMKVDGSSAERLYYVLKPGGETEGKIFTPVEGGKQVLRAIISKEEA